MIQIKHFVAFALALFYFSAGKLCDAAARYEKAIQEESDEIGHHKVKLHLFLCWWLFNSPAQSNPPSK